MAGSKGKGDDLPLRKDGIKSRNGPIFLPSPSNKKSPRPGYIPMRLIYIMALMKQAYQFHGEYHVVDLFAGEKAVSKAFKRKGMRVTSIDIADDSRDDILQPLGFLRALWACMNLRPDGTLVAGIKCSTWSIVNRGTSKRSAKNPLGCRLHRSVREGNLMVARVALLLTVVLHVGAHYLLENPLQSLIFLHPRLKMVLERGSFEQMTWLGMFGAKTWKPVKLVSSSDRVQGFYRKLDKKKFGKSDSTIQYQKDGKKRFQGAKGRLRATQVYPPHFGRKVCQIFSSAPAHSFPNHIDDSGDMWSDARLTEIETYLLNMLNERVNRKRKHA